MANLISTINGLSRAKYISTSQLTSSFDSLLTITANYMPEDVASTVAGLDTFGYISSFDMASSISIMGIDFQNYIEFASTTASLGNLEYISSFDLVSTNVGIGTSILS